MATTSGGTSGVAGAAGFGFELRGGIEPLFGRRGTGEKVDVSIASGEPHRRHPLLHEWRLDGDVRARLYGDHHSGVYRLWQAEAGWFAVDASASTVSAPPADSESDRVLREVRLWGMPMALLMQHRGDLPLHAGAVQTEAGAVMVGGPTRHGKSTLVAALAAAGARVLSEDLTCVRAGRQTEVVPGPALLRLRPDVAEHVHIPSGRVVLDDGDRVHLATDASDPGSCLPVPLVATVLLSSQVAGRPRVSSARSSDALRDLWELSFRPAHADARARWFDLIGAVVDAVPTYSLERSARLDHLDETVELVSDLL